MVVVGLGGIGLRAEGVVSVSVGGGLDCTELTGTVDVEDGDVVYLSRKLTRVEGIVALGIVDMRAFCCSQPTLL